MVDVALTSQFALDVKGTARLEAMAANQERGALREAAQQFEALFVQKMLAAMREASPKSDLLSSSQTDFYQSLMDQQWSQHVSGHGIGLAEQLVQQLSGENPFQETDADFRSSLPVTGGSDDRAHLIDMALGGYLTKAGSHETGSGIFNTRPENATAFVEEAFSQARKVEEETGVPAELMVAQAILETGWGQNQLGREDGSSANNVFGIKAGSSWKGETVEATTHEYIGERRVEVKAEFRAYSSLLEGFRDYAKLITSSERYNGVVSATSAQAAARALQSSGYATDPRYADKLISLMQQNPAR